MSHRETNPNPATSFSQGPRRTASVVTAALLIASSVAVLSISAEAAVRRCFGRKATIVGTSGDDTLTGTNGRDVIVARAGNDLIDARGGRDFICAGRGEIDIIFAGRGKDRVRGGPGFDAVFPGGGNDFVNGGGSFDFVTYEGSSVRVVTDLESGTVVAAGRDRVRNVEGIGGGESDDVLVGDDADNQLFGYGGDDVIVGRSGGDFLSSGAGNDTVRGGQGTDILDLLTARSGPAIGDDELAVSGAVVSMPAGTAIGGADVGEDIFRGIEEVGTTFGDDTLVGDDAPNFLVTFAGNDEIMGAGGDDVLSPGDGDDAVDGGDGADIVDYSVADPLQPGALGPVTVDLQAGTATGLGTDPLTSIEGAGATDNDDTLSGDPGDNVFIGFAGSDAISGEAGDDFLDGDVFFFGVPFNLPGSDNLDGGAGEDICLGGETTANCESEELAPAGRSSRRVQSLPSSYLGGYHNLFRFHEALR